MWYKRLPVNGSGVSVIMNPVGVTSFTFKVIKSNNDSTLMVWPAFIWPLLWLLIGAAEVTIGVFITVFFLCGLLKFLTNIKCILYI